MADVVGLTPAGDVVLQQPRESGNGPQTQITGGGGSQFSGFVQAGRAGGGTWDRAAQQSARSLDALDKLTQGFLKPKIEAAQKQAYFEGMAQVAQGRSLLEVQDDQPWYTQLFGPSATVQGAQAMTMMSALNAQKSDFMEAMPQLRTQSPDAVRQYLVSNASKLSSTGDPFMDAMIQGKLAENFQPMLDLHVKQHISYVQEQNNTAYGNVLMTTAKAYQDQQGADWGMLSPEQRDIQTKQVQATFSKMPGQTDDAWNKTTGQAVQTMLMQGNFAMVKALRESEHWNNLSPQVRETITKLEPYAVAWNQKNNPAYRDSTLQASSLEIAVDNGAAGSWAAVKASMDAKNAEYQNGQGSTTPYYDNNDYANMQKRWWAAQKRLAAAQEKAAGEVQDAQAQRAFVMESVNSASYNPVATNNLDPDIVQRTLVDARADIEADPRVPGGIKVWLGKLAVASEWAGGKMIDRDLSQRMTVDTNNLLQQGGVITDAQRQTIDYAKMFASAPNGAAALAKYVGDENAAKLLFLVKSGADLSDKSTLDALRKVAQEGWATKPVKADIDEVTNYLDKQDPGFLKRHIPVFGPGALSGYDLNDDSKRNMIQQLAPQIAAYRRGLNLSMEEATGLAFQHRYGASSNTDFVDGTFIEPGFLPKGQGLFATVSNRIGGMSQVGGDYQEAVRRAISSEMSREMERRGEPSVPRELTEVDRVANAAAKVANKVLDVIPPTVPGLGWVSRRFNETGSVRPEAGTFNPDDWKTISGLQVGGGVIALTRIQKDPNGNQRPVTVRLSPEAVLKEYDAIKKERAVKQEQQPRIMMNEDAPGLGTQF